MKGFTPLEKLKISTSGPARVVNPSASTTGFTLIETIIYVALFALLMSGVVVSIHPLFSGIERMNERIMVENEVAVVSRTITSLIPQAQFVSVPSSGGSGDTLTLTTYSLPPQITYSFKVEGGAVVASVFGSPWTNLTASRVHFDSMSVSHVAASGGVPAYIELSYVVDGETFGPIRSYLTN